ncbi:hypothetical protein L1987_23374 [Smallanthus sonchifolius]|uniref:Uncharacterized protein n=1 Tax=Smallanthus sonchifolius TaxID=185202 RepID=A0ACB9IIX9_9ASTR|nr:hypothetical protein L1987_23374 [Smallanthus sonchifolius]
MGMGMVMGTSSSGGGDCMRWWWWCPTAEDGDGDGEKPKAVTGEYGLVFVRWCTKVVMVHGGSRCSLAVIGDDDGNGRRRRGDMVVTMVTAGWPQWWLRTRVRVPMVVWV